MKYKMLLIAFLFASAYVVAQEKPPVSPKQTVKNERMPITKLIESVVGSWQLQDTIDKNQKKGQTRKDTLGMAWIEFRPDGKYRSGTNGKTGSIQPVDSGSYRLNEQQGILYLEPSIDKTEVSHPPVEWAITIKKNVMTLEGMGSAHAQRFSYVYQKTKEGLGTSSNK